MTISLNTDNGFEPTSQVGGKKGLHWKKDSNSTATINGSGLSNGLDITVLFPQQAKDPAIKWKGTTADTNSDGTQCTVTLQEKLANNGPPPNVTGDDSTTVSVTATDPSTDQSSNTITPTINLGQ